jgi:hypothetical protein
VLCGLAGLNCMCAVERLGKTTGIRTVRVKRVESRTVVRGTVGLELCVQELCFGQEYIVFQKTDPEVKRQDSVKY